VLILSALLLTLLLHTLPETFAEGLLGGTWCALFLVHILAPVTSWVNLFILWAVLLLGFNLIWYILVLFRRERSVSIKPEPIKPAPEPKPVPPAPPAPKKELQPIVLDTVPRNQPAAPAPVEIKSPAPLYQQIKTDPRPLSADQAAPIIKSPAGIATDTPFLPQVPPLQPIPVILPSTPRVAPMAPIPALTVQSMPREMAAPATPAPANPPVLQKPEEITIPIPQSAPEVKLGLQVMPKSPGEIK
jgi:hypothetical protein